MLKNALKKTAKGERLLMGDEAVALGAVHAGLNVAADPGELFDSLVRCLEDSGIPTFRSADRALAVLSTWTAARLAAAE